MSSRQDSPLRLRKLLQSRQRLRHPGKTFEDSVDDQRPVNIDFKSNPKWKRGHFCWEAKGPVLVKYTQIADQIRTELNQSRKESSHEVAISLFMIGKSMMKAKPIIIISSTDETSRKDARETIIMSSILKDTDFELGLLRHPPSGPIKPVAMEHAIVAEYLPHLSSCEVFFDARERIRLIGMPIYIRHSEGSIRRATANAVYNGKLYGYVTAAHAFKKAEPEMQHTSHGDDMEIPFDSDSENDNDEELRITSQYSETSPETTTSEKSCQSSPEALRSRSNSLSNIQADDTSQSEETFPAADEITDPQTSPSGRPTATEYRVLGKVHSLMAPLDCAVIAVTDIEVTSILGKLSNTIRELENTLSVANARCTKAIAWTSRGPVHGDLTDTPVLMSLSGSASYEFAYTFAHDGMIKMGDCGTLVTDTESKELYGYVIANCNSNRSAYILAAEKILPEFLEIGRWQLLGVGEIQLYGQTIDSYAQPPMSSTSHSHPTTPNFEPSVFSASESQSDGRQVSRTRAEDIVPKSEEVELDLADVTEEADVTPISPTEPVRIHRARDRSRIYPPRSPITLKQAKSRSKHACMTCRKRKKQCDETKPFCLSCQKNNIHCEGYRQLDIFKSGKGKAAEARKWSQDIKFDLPPLMEGVETDLDRSLLQHFVSGASAVLTLHGDKSTNPFAKILLPMALKHEGLMHSVLCLSASHMYSINPLQEYKDRQAFHRGKALQLLKRDLERQKAGKSGVIVYEDSNVAQILLHLLDSICNGNTSGEYRIHMVAAKQIAVNQKSANLEFQSFFDEFLYYHWIASQITSMDGTDVPTIDNFNLPFKINPETAGFIGVSDGLFGFISKISNLRRRLRSRIDERLEPIMDYEALLAANAIDIGLRGWVCPQTPGTPRHTISMLYRQAMWIYLYRTTKDSHPHPYIKSAVNDGIRYINELPTEGWIQSNILLPLFLIGCAVFEKDQRMEINRAFSDLNACTGFGNIRLAKEVVDDIWKLMDAGKSESWDWEKIISQKGWDFLAV